MNFICCLLLTVLGLLSCSSDIGSTSQKKKNDSSVTAILPLGHIDDKQIQLLSNELAAFYGMKLLILPKKTMPESCLLKNTKRYSADSILKWLLKQKPVQCDRILGVTTYDIYTNKNKNPHWGIFGLGYKPGKACIVSDFRLKQFGNRRDTFLTLVTLHEIGHNLGLPHCEKHPACLMNDAKGTAKTLFAEKKWLCPGCHTLLKRP
jgi:archaemetzincin